MHFILAALLAVGAILDLFLGLSFFVDPGTAGTDFGLHSPTPMGLSAMRGDFTAFFWVAALSMGIGAWKRRADVLWPALALFAIAFSGRLVNLVVVGDYDGWWQPMTVEALHVIVLALAIRAFPWNGTIPGGPA